ncbi:MAG: SemiSWEET family sugar transporter [Acidobacteriota bacterium]
MSSSFTLTILGLIAGALTSCSFAFQVWQSWRTKSVNDISAKMYLVFSTGITLWFIYGLLRWDVPLMVWNSLTLVLVAAILLLKFRYGRSPTATGGRQLGRRGDDWPTAALSSTTQD